VVAESSVLFLDSENKTLMLQKMAGMLADDDQANEDANNLQFGGDRTLPCRCLRVYIYLPMRASTTDPCACPYFRPNGKPAAAEFVNAKCLTNSEVALILEQKMNSGDNEEHHDNEMLNKTRAHVTRFSSYTKEESNAQVRA
jgi:hypothetical protein